LKIFIRIIDAINGWVGKVVAWFTLVLVLITVYDVIMRYVFHAGSVAIMELEIHLFAGNFMLAAGWTLLVDGHVRVDLLYTRFNEKIKAWIDLLGTLFLCIPYCILAIWTALPFLAYSWSLREFSPNPGGLPAVYILKAVIPVTFFLIGIQAISLFMKKIYFLTGKGENP
jgi:TRAP-type mannitol/chloroaromatic compound transport system permease small subunit